MDFIERWFGFSPDGGDGSTEMIYIVAISMVFAVVFGRRRIAKVFKAWSI